MLFSLTQAPPPPTRPTPLDTFANHKLVTPSHEAEPFKILKGIILYDMNDCELHLHGYLWQLEIHQVVTDKYQHQYENTTEIVFVFWVIYVKHVNKQFFMDLWSVKK